MLTAVLDSTLKCRAVEAANLAHVCVNFKVMERIAARKNIAYPTDSALLKKLREKMVGFMKKQELTIRQSYSRQGPRLAGATGSPVCPCKAIQANAKSLLKSEQLGGAITKKTRATTGKNH